MCFDSSAIMIFLLQMSIRSHAMTYKKNTNNFSRVINKFETHYQSTANQDYFSIIVFNVNGYLCESLAQEIVQPSPCENAVNLFYSANNSYNFIGYIDTV